MLLLCGHVVVRYASDVKANKGGFLCRACTRVDRLAKKAEQAARSAEQAPAPQSANLSAAVVERLISEKFEAEIARRVEAGINAALEKLTAPAPARNGVAEPLPADDDGRKNDVKAGE